MAKKQSSTKQNSDSKTPNRGLGCLFWVAFLLLVFSLFLLNKTIIQKNFSSLISSLKPSEKTEKQVEIKPESQKSPPPVLEPPKIEKPIASPPAPTVEPAIKPKVEDNAIALAPKDEPKTKEPTPKSPPANEVKKETPPRPPVDLRKRSLWLTHLDKDGTLVRKKVDRQIPASDSPLKDVLETLLAGPSDAEQKKNISSFIPQNTRLLSVIVRGSTAYINVSEDFLFNSYGIEGYAAQLRELVWTATEFPTVDDVQILIEGRRTDFLGSEGIFIGSPLSRDSL